MSIFIDPNQEHPVSDDAGNTIWIKSKMDYGTETAVTTEAARLNRGGDLLLKRPYELALLLHNIKRWEGPLFTGPDGRVTDCDRQHISQFDPNHPLIPKVLAEIDRLNAPPTAPPAVSSNGAGQKKATASVT